jgi:hypothetical protein
MAKGRRSRKSGVLGTTKKVAKKTLGFLEEGLSGLFGIVKSGVQMGVSDVKKGAKMIASRRKSRRNKRRNATRRRKH